MGKQKISDTKVEAIFRMRELGFSMAKIAGALGVSRLTVNDHLNPDSYNKRLRRLTENRRGQVLSKASPTILPLSLRYYQKKPHPSTCKLCEIDNTRLYYHYWDKDKLDAGIWVCAVCRTLSEFVDERNATVVSRSVVRYHLIRGQKVGEQAN